VDEVILPSKWEDPFYIDQSKGDFLSFFKAGKNRRMKKWIVFN